ncbi:MAG: phosphoribosyl 1,2-cyclic phosphodiesterase [Rhodomicrobium sp.]|nr:MAG: phosphoribosyl 1,2-cyclic phosphodiesterase [Rhodomicrobium sp.]
MRFTILGSGASGGTPRIGGDWGGCDPDEPRNRRRRSSSLVEKVSQHGVTRVLIDTSPDLRDQLLDAGVGVVDAVVYTHSHADHTHGIDDLRVVYFNKRERIPTYYDEATGADLHLKFSYCFEQPEDSNYVPILEGRLMEPLSPISIEGAGGVIELLPFRQFHGNTQSLGFKIGNLVYATDVHAFPEESLPLLYDLDVLILDALRARPHPCHFSVDQAVEVIEMVEPKRAFLTHLHVDLDHNELNEKLPDPIETAYDGLVIEFD